MEEESSFKTHEQLGGDTRTSENVDSLLKDLRARRRQRNVGERKDLPSSKQETSSVENLVKKRMENKRFKRAALETSQRSRHRGEQSKTTRFDDTVQVITTAAARIRGEHGEETVRSLSPVSTSRWKKLSMKVGDIVKQNTSRDAYNFFAATLTSADDDIAVPEETGSVGSDVEKESDKEEQDAAKPFQSEGSDIMFAHPTYVPEEERLKSEATVYFKASHTPAAADIQAMTDRAVEEGLYVGSNPRVVPSNVWAFNDRMSHRTDKGQQWFEENGLMRRQRNPLRLLQTRPVVNHENNDLVEVMDAEVCERMFASQSLEGISQLQIEIGSVRFSHHPLFSREHVLSTKVEQAFESYCSRDLKAAEYCDKKLGALRDKINILKQKLPKFDPSDSNATKLRSDIISYLKEVKELRHKKRQLLEADYSLLKTVLRHWKNLKRFRESQGYANTPTSLTFKQLETDVNEETAKMKLDIDTEVAELGELHSFEHGQHTESSSQEDEASRNAGDSNFNKEAVEENLYSYYSKYIRPPGEPQMVPVMANTNPVNQMVNDPSEELRRADVDNTMVYAKIFLNDMEVAQTKKRRLDQHFQVHFDESFIVEIFCLPESVRIEIFESLFVTSHQMAQLYLPIPQAQKVANETLWMDQYEFSSDKLTVYSHSGVGAGIPQDILPDKAVLLTSGNLFATVFWEAQDRDAENLLSPHQTDRFKVWTREGMADSENVKKWIIQSKVDPNDPRNLEFFDLVQNTPSLCTEDAFRILELEDVQRFSTDEFFEYDRRLTLLKLRDEGHYRLSGKPIPLYSSEIPTSMWTEVMQSGAGTDDLPLLSLGDFYSERQAAQNQFLLDIGEKVSQISSQRRDLVLSDIVVSDFIPNISSLKATLLDLLAPRRPLKPRRHAKKEVAHTSIVSTAIIVVRVVRAYNVPLRMSNSTSHPSDQFPQADQTQGYSRGLGVSDGFGSSTVSRGLDRGLVSPFVEVVYEDKVLRTTTSSGANPSWNEDLSMSHDLLEKGFSSDRSTGTLHFSLFDEILVDILEDDRERATTIHQRIQKQFIGSLRIPLSTIRQRQKIEGTFQLEVPPLLLGYSTQGSQNSSGENAHGSLRDSPKCQLQLFISLDPPLGITSPLKDVVQSEEDPRHLEFTNQKLKVLQVKFPSRNIFSTAMDKTGNLVFLSRYIHPQNPPLEVLQDATTLTQKMEFLARYVSLIPFFSESLQVTREYNAWITSDYFLQLLGGNVEQHAVLLCNYFLNCGIQAWLLLGHAIPEGKTAYVLTRSPLPEDVGYWIWNSSTGIHYYQNEPGIPLISVGCVINESNIWANVQEHDHPSLVVFETKNSKLWMPLLPSDMTWTTVQQDLVYSQTDSYKVKEIQQRFERSARDFIMRGRNRFVTKWNRHCTKSLQGILPLLESSWQTVSLTDHYQALNEVRAGYDLSGFPMNVRYSDADHLLEAIERTGIHLNEGKNAEFGLAVHIHPYPNDILSLWVYIVCMIPK